MRFLRSTNNRIRQIVCRLGAACLGVAALGVTAGGSAFAQTDAERWIDISSDTSVSVSNPVRSRRSADATVDIVISNTSDTDYNEPVWIELDGLSGYDGITLSGASGTSEDGDPYYVISGAGLLAGETTDPIRLTISGGRSYFEFDATVYTEEEEEVDGTLPQVAITSPLTLTTVGTQSVEVSGTVSENTSILTLNGERLTPVDGVFSGFVNLDEGLNTIIARATTAGGAETTASIVVSQDLTPPVVTIETPTDGQRVNTNTVSVSGLVNDIVRGTVTESEASVTVNGRAASIENRTYLASSVPLDVGENTIEVFATDQVGNVGSTSITVVYAEPAPKKIVEVSGQNQSGEVFSILENPLQVKLETSDGEPAVDQMVVFRVTQGDGKVGAGTELQGNGVLVKTNAQGIASTQYRLGARSGTGNHRVRATATGFDGQVAFFASAEARPGDKISIIDGNNQRGAPNQPLPKPLTVSVTDEGSNLIRGAEVTFEVTDGGGRFDDGSRRKVVQTDGDGRASVVMDLGDEIGLDVHRVAAILSGADAVAGFTASALEVGEAGDTTISGIVLDNQDDPVPGVTIRIEGVNRQAVADEEGIFVIEQAPVGPVHLIADGSTASVPGEWPSLSYNIVTVSGADNPLAAPIYMVQLDTENARLVGLEDVDYTVPEVPGFMLSVKKGSVTFPDGATSGLLSVTPVNANKVPMAPPNGMQPQLIVTIQPAGTKFDPPAPLQLPNVDSHAPGAQVEMYSYDHDLEEFVTIGLGTVSDDGSIIKSNNGVGVVKAGWHCGSQPTGSGCCVNCGDCQRADANCNCIAAPELPLPDTAGDCKKPEGDCENGPKFVDDDGDTPEDTPGDCKMPVCMGGAAKLENDDSDSPEDNKCKFCEDGELKDKELKIGVETSESFSFPAATVDNINRWLQAFKVGGASVTVSYPTLELKGSASDCCDRETGEITPFGKTALAVEGKIGIGIEGRVWPPGPKLDFRGVTLSFGALGSISFSFELDGGVFASLNAELGVGAQLTTDICNDLEQCLEVAFGGNITPALEAKFTAQACVTTTGWWSDSRECYGTSLSLVKVSAKLCAGVKYYAGDCGGKSGFEGAGFAFGGFTISFGASTSVSRGADDQQVRGSGSGFKFGPYLASANAGACL